MTETLNNTNTSTTSSPMSSSSHSHHTLHPSVRASGLRIPSVVSMNPVVEPALRRIYANAHTYHVNSISVNSDQETFLSADDLRINIWHQDITDESFNIVDIKPANMEELTEVITAAEFHPSHCNHFVYSSSKGILRLCDMRAAALCDQHAKGECQVYRQTCLRGKRRTNCVTQRTWFPVPGITGVLHTHMYPFLSYTLIYLLSMQSVFSVCMSFSSHRFLLHRHYCHFVVHSITSCYC